MKVKRFLFVMLLAIITAAAALLGACVEEPEQVKITKITSMSEINSLLGDDFSVEAEARAAEENFYDEITDFSFENGEVSGEAEKDGELLEFFFEVTLSASDFEAKKYENAEYDKSAQTLTYYDNGEEKSENVADMFVKQEDGAIIVINVENARAAVLLCAMNRNEITWTPEPEPDPDPEPEPEPEPDPDPANADDRWPEEEREAGAANRNPSPNLPSPLTAGKNL